MMKFFYLTVAGAFLLSQPVSGSKGELIDWNPYVDLDSSDICQHTDKRITRLSSVKKLLDQFVISADEKCRNKWEGPLYDLQQVLYGIERDACGKEAIDGIHLFHWHYIVGTLSRSWRKASKFPIPEPLRIFFMNLVDEIAERCKSKLADRLREALADSSESKSLSQGSFGFTYNTLSIALVTKENVKTYDDFFLLIDSLVDAERKKGKKTREWLNEATGESVVTSIQLKNVSRPLSIQQQCIHHLKPVYANTVLPVMKLIDMGYGNRGDRVGDDELLKSWYSMTQICQLILPVEFQSSSSLENDQVALVGEEEEIQRAEGSPAGKRLPDAKRVTPVRVEDILTSATNEKIAKKVRSNLKSRGRIYRRTFKNVLFTFKSGMKSVVKSIFVSRKKGDKFVAENDAGHIQASLNAASEELDEEEFNDLELDERKAIRHKRSSQPSVSPVLVFIIVCILLLMIVNASIGIAHSG